MSEEFAKTPRSIHHLLIAVAVAGLAFGFTPTDVGRLDKAIALVRIANQFDFEKTVKSGVPAVEGVKKYRESIYQILDSVGTKYNNDTSIPVAVFHNYSHPEVLLPFGIFVPYPQRGQSLEKPDAAIKSIRDILSEPLRVRLILPSFDEEVTAKLREWLSSVAAGKSLTTLLYTEMPRAERKGTTASIVFELHLKERTITSPFAVPSRVVVGQIDVAAVVRSSPALASLVKQEPYLGELDHFWDVLSHLSPRDALKWLRERRLSEQETITVVGITVPIETVVLLFPGLTFFLSIYFLSHLCRFAGLVVLEDPNPTYKFPWVVLFPDTLGLAIAVGSAAVLPSLSSVLVLVSGWNWSAPLWIAIGCVFTAGTLLSSFFVTAQIINIRAAINST